MAAQCRASHARHEAVSLAVREHQRAVLEVLHLVQRYGSVLDFKLRLKDVRNIDEGCINKGVVELDRLFRRFDAVAHRPHSGSVPRIEVRNNQFQELVRFGAHRELQAEVLHIA